MRTLRYVDEATIERITGWRIRHLEALAASVESLYREDHETRNGKTRTLLKPHPKLKRVQSRLHHRLLRRLEPHPAAFCAKGRSALLAAKCHAGNRWFFHADIRSFYPNVSPDAVEDGFRRLRLRQPLCDLLVRLVTVRGQLPQGAPTSSSVGEIVLFPLDNRIAGLAKRARLTYTRYADDITVSGGRHLEDRLATKIRAIVADCGWELNEKGGIFGPGERHKMLGLIVNQDPNVSRNYSDKLRFILKLARKEKIRLSRKQLQSLHGKIGWIKQVNPVRGARLERQLAALETPTAD